QHLRHRHDFRVRRESLSNAGDPRSNGEPIRVTPDGADDARGAVAQWHGLVETIDDLGEGACEAFGPCFLDDATYEIGARFRLCEQTLASKLDDRPLGAEAHQRSARLDEHLA